MSPSSERDTPSPHVTPASEIAVETFNNGNLIRYLVALNSKTALLIEDALNFSNKPNELLNIQAKMEEVYLGWKAMLEGNKNDK